MLNATPLDDGWTRNTLRSLLSSQRSLEESITVRLKNKQKEIGIEYFLARFEPEDIAKFLEHVAANFPALVSVSE